MKKEKYNIKQSIAILAAFVICWGLLFYLCFKELREIYLCLV